MEKIVLTNDEWELLCTRFLMELEADVDDLRDNVPEDWSEEQRQRWLKAGEGILRKLNPLRPKSWKPKWKKLTPLTVDDVMARLVE